MSLSTPLNVYIHTHSLDTVMYQRAFTSDGNPLPKRKENSEVHMHVQGDLLLPIQHKFFNQNGNCCMN